MSYDNTTYKYWSEWSCDGTDAPDHGGEGEQAVAVLRGVQLRRVQVQRREHHRDAELAQQVDHQPQGGVV